MEKQKSDIRILSGGEIIRDVYPDRQVIGGAPVEAEAQNDVVSDRNRNGIPNGSHMSLRNEMQSFRSND